VTLDLAVTTVVIRKIYFYGRQHILILFVFACIRITRWRLMSYMPIADYMKRNYFIYNSAE